MDDNNMSDGGNSTPNPITKTTQPIVGTTNTTSTTPADTIETTTETTTGVAAPAKAPATAKTIPVTSPEPDHEETVASAEPAAKPSSMVEDTAADMATPTAVAEPKKKHTSLIATIIAVALVLIIGIGFAAFALIKNQPENIAAESFVNLLNADKVAVSGDFTVTPKNETSNIVGPVTISLDTKSSDNNQSANAVVTVSFPEQNKSYELGLGETMLKNGVLYIKASGLTEIFQGVVSPLMDTYLSGTLNQKSNTSIYQDCYSIEDTDAYLECMDQIDAMAVEGTMDTVIDTTIDTTANMALVTEYKNQVENIFKKVDDQWFEISIKDILDSELISQYLDPSIKENILKTYDCSVDMLNRKSDYLADLSNLYQENKFAKVTSSDDSYYQITFDDAKLANYLNGMRDTKFISDLATCGNVSINNNNPEITAEDTSKITKNLPNIYAKFDGFLTHHLTGLKIEQDTDYFSISSNLNVTYPANLTISAPENSRPIMDLIEELMTSNQSTMSTFGSN